MLAINAAADERNPPELRPLDREIKRVKRGRVQLIPASEKTSGRGATGNAVFYAKDMGKLMKSAPRMGM